MLLVRLSALWLYALAAHAATVRSGGVHAAARASPATSATPSVRIPATAAPPVVPRAAPPRPTVAARDPKDDDMLPAGGLTVTQPAQTADESYYKIAPHVSVTFGWSFTSLKTQPKNLFVVASCSQNGYTYPIAPSPSGLPGDATGVTWYPYGYRLSAQAHGQPDLAAAKYRLLIYDENGPSAGPKPGGFSPNNGVEFALYFPQAYTPLAEWSCGSCSGAATLSVRSPLVLSVLGTLLAGALSALWLLP